MLTFKQHASGQQMLLVGAAVWKRQDALISQSAPVTPFDWLCGDSMMHSNHRPIVAFVKRSWESY